MQRHTFEIYMKCTLGTMQVKDEQKRKFIRRLVRKYWVKFSIDGVMGRENYVKIMTKYYASLKTALEDYVFRKLKGKRGVSIKAVREVLQKYFKNNDPTVCVASQFEKLGIASREAFEKQMMQSLEKETNRFADLMTTFVDAQIRGTLSERALSAVSSPYIKATRRSLVRTRVPQARKPRCRRLTSNPTTSQQKKVGGDEELKRGKKRGLETLFEKKTMKVSVDRTRKGSKKDRANGNSVEREMQSGSESSRKRLRSSSKSYSRMDVKSIDESLPSQGAFAIVDTPATACSRLLDKNLSIGTEAVSSTLPKHLKETSFLFKDAKKPQKVN